MISYHGTEINTSLIYSIRVEEVQFATWVMIGAGPSAESGQRRREGSGGIRSAAMAVASMS
jgi:hypothetical protein